MQGIKRSSNRLIQVVAIFALFVSFTSVSAAAEENNDSRWLATVKGGIFEPDFDQYETFYGSDHTSYYGVSFSYLFRQHFEVGVGLDYSRSKGKGWLPQNQQTGGEVRYSIMPVHAYVGYRGKFSAAQGVVPYVSLGLTYLRYEQKVLGQDDVDGGAGGFHWRAGVQFRLNSFDRAGAGKLSARYGIENTYLSLEYQSVSAKSDDIELGGQSMLIGLVLEI